MACNCRPIIPGNPPQTPQSCLCINDVRVGCDSTNTPNPCGGTLVINLATYNDVRASPCEVVYTLRNFNTTAFTSVTLTQAGLLTIVTSSNFVKSTEFEIGYKVDSPCSILSDTATVYVCMKDLCGSKNCPGGCDPCTSDCIPLLPEVSINNVNTPKIQII